MEICPLRKQLGARCVPLGDRAGLLGHLGQLSPEPARGARGHPATVWAFRRIARQASTRLSKSKLRAEWARLTPPTLVVCENAIDHPAVRARRAAPARRPHRNSLGRRQGGTLRSVAPIGQMPVPRQPNLDGRNYERRQAPLPDRMPLGYHELECLGRGRSPPVAHLIVTPDRAWIPPRLAAGRAGRGRGHQPLRTAQRAQLGLRRPYRSGAVHRLGGRGTGR